MRRWNNRFRAAAVSVSVLTLASLLSTSAFASAANGSDSTQAKPISTHISATSDEKLSVKKTMETSAPSKQALIKGAKTQYVRHPSLQCVPFARAASGIELKGNAANWWDAASGNYARGQAPEAGAVLNFRATRGMRLGHVAVVTDVVSAREVVIDHANWAGPGASKEGVSRGISVIDVSPENNWSQVRVGLGGENYGSVYPTYGFIYDRPDNGVFVTNVINESRFDEVAEAPSRSVQ